MSKLPVIKDRQLIRVLKKLGFFEHPERGTSHLVFKHPDGRITTVARHPGKDMPRGTLRAILRDINISITEFIQFLKK
ncbi:type II toxin-antitoxin system HicA family toxin [Candidatus Azambacteria bacterium]|nr:type II toxin-antitoxin system HicA family toxin [Candidatus Azambacteria bacterium]MBI3685685.1 type II toxin-antitoxin system HicA family toxin [Candidatus Azambacteria bacterium]